MVESASNAPSLEDQLVDYGIGEEDAAALVDTATRSYLVAAYPEHTDYAQLPLETLLAGYLDGGRNTQWVEKWANTALRKVDAKMLEDLDGGGLDPISIYGYQLIAEFYTQVRIRLGITDTRLLDGLSGHIAEIHELQLR